jgi:hypothetical protein
LFFYPHDRGHGPLLQDCYNKNNIGNTGQGQSRPPDSHPVVFAAHAGYYKPDTDEQAEYGNGEEGTLIRGRG